MVRIFWIVALITVWLGVIFAIHNQVLNYINSSVVISVSGEKVSILDAPFPAITICSKNQMRPSLLNSAETISNKSPSDLKRLHVYTTLASFCEASSIGDYNYDIQLNHSIIRDDWEFFYFWKQIASDECRNIFKQVKWKNVRGDDPCRDAEASMTVDGICYSFNLMSPSRRYNEKYGALTLTAKLVWLPFVCLSFTYNQVQNRFIDNEIGKEQNPCGCLPGCNEYEYEMRSYPTTQTWAESLNSSSGISTYGFHLDRNKLKSYSSIKLEYNNEGIAKKSRIGIYSFTGFIAQIGGLLGLFVGFSLVSLIEIIYFTSIRWVATNAENNKSANNMPSTFMN
ncbi:hypothetical protein LSTR_LSTR009050 [Laodelphax striatellus]|uniref:Uncharacterized protein n=2 Tax=Laodelphax striatellus TaxID=195883 RepID=A0A482WJA6_LAOST|nr:hypothetical protein LSTR_LSTR009050 [Laodelphax striatellus]